MQVLATINDNSKKVVTYFNGAPLQPAACTDLEWSHRFQVCMVTFIRMPLISTLLWTNERECELMSHRGTLLTRLGV